MTNYIIEGKEELMTMDLAASPVGSPRDDKGWLSKIPLPNKVLMVTPNYFNVDHPINAHMVDAQGHLHHLDKKKALLQWQELKSVYERLGLLVSVVEGVQGLPDMVFCANQSFPYLSQGKTRAVLSNMKDDTRHQEVAHIDNFLTAQGYSTQPITERSPVTLFEGMGDVCWLGDMEFMLGGYGIRTNKNIYSELVKIVNTSIAIFELNNPKFYHLDTCLSVFNSTTALVCKAAFTAQGYELLQAIFPNLLEVPLSEADAPGFACNAHCPDERHVIIQQGNKKSVELIQKYNFVPIEVDTSEFIKSGGSVYCMKLMYF